MANGHSTMANPRSALSTKKRLFPSHPIVDHIGYNTSVAIVSMVHTYGTYILIVPTANFYAARDANDALQTKAEW